MSIHTQRHRDLPRLGIATALLCTLASWHAAWGGGTPETTDWSLFGSTSSVRMLGGDPTVADQDIATAAAAGAAGWRTIGTVAFPQIGLFGGETIDLVQNAEASGSYDPATGAMTLTLPLTLIDSLGANVSTASFSLELTTETTNATDPDGGSVCLGQPSDPAACQGTRRDPSSGAFRLVAIAAVPEGSGTGVDRELLYVELDGEIVPSDLDSDGLESFVDNCPSNANAGQADLDADGIGDVCDSCTDLDHDGFGSPGDASCDRGASADCNDLDPTIFPGGPEFCDGLDNDCDTTPDDAICADFDVNSDGLVDGTELAWLGRAFGLCSANPATEWWSGIDIYADGCVDGDDLALLIVVWSCDPGPICP